MAAAILFMALLGMVVGSFISVVAHRVPLGESPLRGRSRCPHCDEQIRAYDNIPVFSWLLLRGRCRDCGGSISIRYPLIEAGLGAVFVLAFVVFEDDPAELALACVFATTLLAVSLTDLEDRIIPNSILITTAVIGLAIMISTDPGEMPERLIAATAAFALLFVVALVYPSGMGMGDVKLAGLMGLYLGRAVAPALLIGFAVGAIFGLALIAMHGAEARKQAIPFGPFLAFGALVCVFAGDEIVDWYLDSFVNG